MAARWDYFMAADTDQATGLEKRWADILSAGVEFEPRRHGHGLEREVARLGGLPFVIGVDEHDPARRITEALLGQIPTTRQLRLSSLPSHSSELVFQNWR